MQSLARDARHLRAGLIGTHARARMKSHNYDFVITAPQSTLASGAYQSVHTPCCRYWNPGLVRFLDQLGTT
jgi:hypothetical protein